MRYQGLTAEEGSYCDSEMSRLVLGRSSKNF
jgi:hypothetical protein